MSGLRPRLAPYATARRPFTIGLAPIDPARWLAPDDLADSELAEKARLLAACPAQTILSQSGTEAAQQEVLTLVCAFLGRALPAGQEEPPIVAASRLVQDDLCLMRRGAEGWRLVAASLCFPSNWSLVEKAGLAMGAIHESVPGYVGRMAGMVERIFDRLPADQIVERLNWSIADDGVLHQPAGKDRRPPVGGNAMPFVRVERQTLRRLPASGDILFTIRVHVDPLSAFARHPEGARLAGALAAQLAGLDADQLAYKGLTQRREALLAQLRQIAEVGGGVEL